MRMKEWRGGGGGGRKQSNEREGLRLGQGDRNVEHYRRTREAAFFYGLRTLKDGNLNIWINSASTPLLFPRVYKKIYWPCWPGHAFRRAHVHLLGVSTGEVKAFVSLPQNSFILTFCQLSQTKLKFSAKLTSFLKQITKAHKILWYYISYYPIHFWL